MKKIFKYISISFLAVFLAACSKDETGDTSLIKYYVNLKLNGKSELFIEKGNTFTDPGFVAIENDKDVSSKVNVTYLKFSQGQTEVIDNITTDTPGTFLIMYDAVSDDGYPASNTRAVIVYDKDNSSDLDISGNYEGFGIRTQALQGGGNVTISKVKNGIFYISDYFGGYYEYYRKYGSGYTAPGYFQLNKDNSITWLYGYTSAWGEIVYLEDSEVYGPAAYNPSTKVLTMYSWFDVKFTYTE